MQLVYFFRNKALKKVRMTKTVIITLNNNENLKSISLNPNKAK